ncbi:hypothetical protein V1517DRAFT_11373 [Lipomyces orientalis]|uniref:Uncharacterized protein n=1 Tax=Lipomyces orientalis TaxID=1233043 RepID=A0ACC3THL8_9ASCO
MPNQCRLEPSLPWAAFDATGFSEQTPAKDIPIPAPVALCLTWLSEKAARILLKEPFLIVKDLGDGPAQTRFDNAIHGARHWS